jgi:hypothetical protein
MAVERFRGECRRRQQHDQQDNGICDRVGQLLQAIGPARARLIDNGPWAAAMQSARGKTEPLGLDERLGEHRLEADLAGQAEHVVDPVRLAQAISR